MKERNSATFISAHFFSAVKVATLCTMAWTTSTLVSCGPMNEIDQQYAADEAKYDGGKNDQDKHHGKHKDKHDEQGGDATSPTTSGATTSGETTTKDDKSDKSSADKTSADETSADKTGSDADNRKGAHGHDQPKTAAKWYITMHGEPGGNTVHALSGEGEMLGNILEAVPESAGGNAKGVRGMLHTGEHGLMVVSASMENTRLLRYGAPTSDGELPFLSVFASKELSDPNLVHSYALAVGANGTIYASNQDTNTVTAYEGIGTLHPGQPVPVPAEIVGLGIPAGTIVPRAQVSPQGITEIRGIAIGADNLLYVCDRGASQVVVFDPKTGLRKSVLADATNGLKHPIQLLFAPDGFTLYLTDNGVPAIFRINVKTGNIILFANTATGCPALPSSLAMDNEHLYVGDRKKKQIIRFKIANGECDKKPFAESLPDAPEFMIPSTPMPPASKLQPSSTP